MSNQEYSPKLSLAHATLSVTRFEEALDFYRDVLGFQITNRGEVPGGGKMAFISQDPNNHHQIAMVEAAEPVSHAFVMADHLAFRTGSLQDLRILRDRLTAAGIQTILPICHGNAWSLYFSDPEGNGLECFVDTPFHVAQPFAQGFDLDQPDEEIAAATKALIESEPEFQPMADWKAAFEDRLG